jgi:hypothetical protein
MLAEVEVLDNRGKSGSEISELLLEGELVDVKALMLFATDPDLIDFIVAKREDFLLAVDFVDHGERLLFLQD